MRIIAVLNPKGGSGKTTLATNLARACHDRGLKTLLVNSDPQGSASDWHAARDDNPLPFLAYGKPENFKALPGIAEAYDYVLIDGAAKLTGMIAAALKVADSVLIPVQPSPYDIWAAADLVELIKTRQEVTGGTPQAAFLISRAIKRTVLSRDPRRSRRVRAAGVQCRHGAAPELPAERRRGPHGAGGREHSGGRRDHRHRR